MNEKNQMNIEPLDPAEGGQRPDFARVEQERNWNITPAEAIAIQERLRHRIETQDRFGEIHWIAASDIGFRDGGMVTRAAAVVMSWPALEPVEQAVVELPTCFPYVPGLLSFREVPAALAALEQLKTRPDLVLVDGQGIAHPRRLGVASHLGLLADIPTIGVAKSRLTGWHKPVPDERGAWVPLMQGQERIGAVLRSRQHVRPLYVSSGHRVSLESALRITLACLGRYRLPEPIRWADKLASRRGPFKS